MEQESAERWVQHQNPLEQEGFTQFPNAVLRNFTLSVPARLLYVLLKSWAWEKDESFPGQECLSELMGVTDRQIRRYVRELEEAGLIETRRRGLGKSNMYVLLSLDQMLDRTVASALTGHPGPVETGHPGPTKNTKMKNTKKKKTPSGQKSATKEEPEEDKRAYNILRNCFNGNGKYPSDWRGWLGKRIKLLLDDGYDEAVIAQATDALIADKAEPYHLSKYLMKTLAEEDDREPIL